MLALDSDNIVVEGIGGGRRQGGGGVQDIGPSISKLLDGKFRRTPLDIHVFQWDRSS